MKIINLVKKEAVLFVALFLAVISAALVHPDDKYLSYVDLRTLGLLFSLMCVMAGLKSQGVFEKLGIKLLSHTKTAFRLILALVTLCFFGSMLITNDVALITFVPFTFIVLNSLGEELKNRLIFPVVCMQTIAANLGSMMTPIGNPQNLYLYGRSGISIKSFLLLMLPYTAASLFLLVIWIGLICKKNIRCDCVKLSPDVLQADIKSSRKMIAMYVFLFMLCLMTVIRLIPWQAAFFTALALVMAADRKTLAAVDYSLLLTFVAFFVFIGNLGRIAVFSEWLKRIINGHVVIVSVLASQVTSNVPAALLLSGFTSDYKSLIIGTNIGGLGTLIASMASLISYRQIAREYSEGKGRYFAVFSVANIIFLMLLLTLYIVLRNI